MPENRSDAPNTRDDQPAEPLVAGEVSDSTAGAGAGAYQAGDAAETARMESVASRRRHITERFLNAGEAVEHTSLAVIVLRPDLRISAWNQYAAALLGTTAEEAIGAALHDVLAPLGEVVRSVVAHCERVLETGRPAKLLEVPVHDQIAAAVVARQGLDDKSPPWRRQTRTRRASTRLHGVSRDALQVSGDTSIRHVDTHAIYLDFVVDPIVDDPTVDDPTDAAANPAGSAPSHDAAEPFPSPPKLRGIVLTVHDATERARLRLNLERRSEDLQLMFDVSNALRGTMELDEALFITLSALTADKGGAFDRAFLFLTDDPPRSVTGRVGVSSLPIEQARAIWRDISAREDTLEELLRRHDADFQARMQNLTERLQQITIPLARDSGVIARCVLDRRPFTEASLVVDPTLRVTPELQAITPLTCFVSVPLMLKDRVLGVLMLDSSSVRRTWPAEVLQLLEMYALQSALAIENAHVYARAIREAHTDALTGLHNHGYFQQVTRRAISQAQRYGEPVSLTMIDIDHFKQFNDTWGHPAGDDILRLLARFFRESTRESDLAARYGGEEFALLMPRTSPSDAYMLAERLRARVDAELEFVAPDGRQHPLTASFGVASFPLHAADAKTLIAAADAALYAAKRQGRNRTVLYGAHQTELRP